MVLLRLLPLLLLAAALLAGCGGDDSAQTTSPAQATSTTAKNAKTGTTDRGARRCTRAAFLGALLADVDPLPFKVDEVRCAGDFGRARFVNAGCAAQQGVACDGAQVAAWRRGAKRWRLIAYADSLRCAEVRRKAADFPQSLCD